MTRLAIAILLGISLAGFAFSISIKLKLLNAAQKERRFSRHAKRAAKMLEFAVGQLRFFKHGRVSGLLHALIFWGFIAVALRTIILFGQGFDPDFATGFMQSSFGKAYSIFKNSFQAIVIVACTALIFRRAFLKPKRLTQSAEAYLILVAIILLMTTDFMIDAGLFKEAAYFAHIILILGFLNWLPWGKHFHIVTSLPNVYLQKLPDNGALSKIDLENENATVFGVEKIIDFGWKSLLDFFTCTECGRCEEVCPAFASGKALSPKKIGLSLRDHLFDLAPSLVELPVIFPSTTDRKNALTKNEIPPLVDNVISPDEIWSCTTCKACEEACPLFIGYVDKICELRRSEVLMKGALPNEAAQAMRNVETNANPWGFSATKRADWALDLHVKTLAQDNSCDFLYFVGCAGSFDERAKSVSRAFVRILNAAGVSFGILGTEERCAGDFARRLGNEYLFQTLAAENIALLKKYGVKKILTTCPHCFNTLKNEYPQFGGDFEVRHHAEFLLELINKGALRLPVTKNSKLVYHDSCYLGRYNGIYDEPRKLLEGAGYEVTEPKNTRDFARCCGAGGGRMWMEEKPEQKVSHLRLQDFEGCLNNGAEKIVSACPFCLTMISDAAKECDKNYLQTLDIAEILAAKLDG